MYHKESCGETFRTFTRSKRKISHIEALVWNSPGEFEEESIKRVATSLIYLEAMIDDFLSGECVFVSTPLLMTKYKGMWYVGANFTCFIQKGIDTELCITEGHSEVTSGTPYQEVEKVILKRYPGGVELIGQLGKKVIEEYLVLQREYSLDALSVAVKKLQIAKKLPGPKKNEYLDKALDFYEEVGKKYPYAPTRKEMHSAFPVGKVLRNQK
jgi:hypothetical protein